MNAAAVIRPDGPSPATRELQELQERHEPREIATAAAQAYAPRAVRVIDVVKDYESAIGVRRVLDGISFEVFQGEKFAVLGRNGAGKSTLVRLMGGVEKPTRGHIARELNMSWPLGFTGAVEGEMTGMDNIRFISRLYNKNVEDVAAFVDDFAELGRYLFVPVNNYSSGMRMRLGFALTLAVDFECLLIDEVTAVGDQRFHRKCFDAVFIERAHCAIIMVSHDINTIRTFCQKAMVLKNGRGRVFDDVEKALEIYASL
mgnify:FL=1